MPAVHVPAPRHICAPPEHRPRNEWHTIAPPRAWMKPEDAKRAKPVPIPTPYPAGTVWRCSCSRRWFRIAAYLGQPGYWAPVRWYHRRLRHQAAIGEARLAYEAAAQIVESWDAP